LIFFINHIAQAISVNHIVDRIARETELVIDELMPHRRTGFETASAAPPPPPGHEVPILNQRSGYIRFVDLFRLVALTKAYRIRIHVQRGVGQFVPSGVPLLLVSHEGRIPPDGAAELLAAFDIGPTRTMQQDVEFGIIQIVDIALRAISPAVNDPSTAISCIDQLSSVLIRWLSRAPPPPLLYDPPHIVRVVVPWIGLDGLLDTAFEQIRHYAATDLAVGLRLMRALGDITATVQRPEVASQLLSRARRVVAGCAERLEEQDMAKLRHRLALLEAHGIVPGG
jgi:uncharacterized membrane protein